MAAYRYVLRAWDSGSGGRWVQWLSDMEPPNLSPASTDTTPNYTGSLSSTQIIGKILRLGGWQDVLDVDFAALPSLSPISNGVNVIGGWNWTKENSAADAVALAIVNGTGLVYQPVASSGIYPPGPTRTGPILRIDPPQLYPRYTFGTGLKIWVYFTLNNALDFDHLKMVVETATAAANVSCQVMRLTNGGDRWGFNSYYNGGVLVNAYTATDLSDNVMVMELPDGILGNDWRLSTGTYSSGWPADEILRTQHIASPLGTGRDVTGQVTEASAVNILLECGRDGSGTSLSGVVKRFRVQMKL